MSMAKLTIFQPHYTITPRLLANIKHIAELVSELNHSHFSKVVLLDFERRAREVSAHSSTSIEGNPLPLTEVKKIMKHAPEHVRDSEREVLNYNRALEHLNTLFQQGKNSFNLKLILDIQKIVMAGLIDKFRSSNLRQEPVFVNNPQTRQPIYFPPDHQDVPRLIDNLLMYVNENKAKLDPLIIAGIFHKQFVIIHPFIDGNGRTARLATKVLLAGMGLNTFNLFSFENYYNQNVTKYFQNVGLVGNYYDLEDMIDFTLWLEYFTDGIIDELLRVGGELAKSNSTPATKLQSYHHIVIDYIKKHGFIKDSDYALLTKRARPTRNLDFKKLIGLELIEKQDKGKATYYVLKNKP
ncbi:MAG: Fic family protein [Candidatus Berkelbacteria bacterium Licking1014_7]|uniref:Fic family protein n=1 Tax=Candidatus Berkelbacteria bacterium Licking1014_7 TaxID=2017147 RepID=A0A554LJ25_9BACT|nr:MAG: Fic family protein [Candidatus Berkelbacteria bacterium Licking1014_7]